MVANAVIYRRYYKPGTTQSGPYPTLYFLLSFSFFALCFTLLWRFLPPGASIARLLLLSIFGACAIACLCIFKYTVPQAQKPEFWGVPLMPWIPAVSIFLNIFLLGSLDGPSYVRFGVFSIVVVLFYVLYSVHGSYDVEEKGGLVAKVGDAGVDEDGSLKV
jgi:phosphatidylserine synthase